MNMSSIASVESITGGCASDVDSGISHSPETVSNGSVARDSEETDCAVFQSALLGSTGYELYIRPDGKQGLRKPPTTSTDSPPPRLPLSSESAVLHSFIEASKAPPPEYADLCTSKKLKQKLDQRIKRRNANATMDHFLVSRDADFGHEFTENYATLIEDKQPSLRIYKILVNSAVVWFAGESDSPDLPRVIDFFANTFLQTSDEINAKNLDSDRLLQELEVMILIEIFTLTRIPRPIAQTDVIKKLRGLAFDGSRMRRFLEDVLCDEFTLELPLFLTQVFEELGMNLPPELEPYESQENLESANVCDLPVKQKMSRKKEILDAMAPVRRSPRKSKPVVPFSPDKNFIRRTPIKTEPSLKRKYVAAETPDDKLIKRQCTDGSQASLPNESVAETPLGKLKKLRSKDSKEFTEQLIKTEATEKRRASKRLSFARPTVSASQSSPALSSQISFSSYSQPGPSSLAAPSAKCISRSVASLSRVPSTKSMASVSSFDSVDVLPPPPKPKPPPGERITAAMNASKVLTPDILARYRQRMETVRSSSKRASPSEIFYGRSAGRPNLFAPTASTTENLPEQPKRATASGQMNRSGRKVVQDCSSVYVAHTLLNTHNLTPLAPFKPPRDVEFKIHKLVRHASRKDWQRLQKFMMKSPRMSCSIDTTDDPEATSSSAP